VAAYAAPALYRKGPCVKEIGGRQTAIIRNTTAVWRRYHQMRKFPSGLVVIGDALCSLDPTYGQGMTMAAPQALTLRDCLSDGRSDLAQRSFGATPRRCSRHSAARESSGA
jgi:2-polyprenyl-6-methoxyphenol hydroxylase-like FAD-dependent oxidoreductase